MKHYITLFAVLFFAIGFSQTTTTVEEYRYLTEGYGKQIENGLDIYKEGYELEPLFNTGDVSGYSFDYYKFKKTDTKELKAIFIVCQKIKKGKKDKARYLAIPFNNGELIKEFNYSFNVLGVSMKSMLEMVNMFAFSEIASRLDALETKNATENATE